MIANRILWSVGLFIAAGCYREPAQTALSDNDQEFKRLQREIMDATNIFPDTDRNYQQETPPAQLQRDEDQIQLTDLDIVLRKVTFEKPINNLPAVFFSEAEITNRAFAAYLAETRQWRDDTTLEQVEERRSKGIVTTTPEGATSTWIVTSTGWPAMDIQQKASLWRNGFYPEGRGEHPVSFITMQDGTNFCDWLAARYELDGEFRLPTEQEWLFAAYGPDRKFPWGDDERAWAAPSTHPVKARPELRTPDGLYEMWGNVSEFVLSRSSGYGWEIADDEPVWITQWLGASYEDDEEEPRQDYWGYKHSKQSRSDAWGFRIVFVPSSGD